MEYCYEPEMEEVMLLIVFLKLQFYSIISREHNGGEMLHMFYPTGQFQMKGEQVCGNEETKNLIQFLSIIGNALLT